MVFSATAVVAADDSSPKKRDAAQSREPSEPDLESEEDELLKPRTLKGEAEIDLLVPHAPVHENPTADNLVRPRYLLRARKSVKGARAEETKTPAETANIASPAESTQKAEPAATGALVAQPGTDTAAPASPGTAPANSMTTGSQASNLSFDSQLTALEKHFFQTAYTGDTEASRLDRLESFVFGGTKHGLTPWRLDKLQAAIASSGTPSSNVASNKADTKPESQGPASASAAYDRAMEYMNQRAYHAAEEALEGACSLSPGEPKYHYWLGRVRQLLNDPKGAKEEFETAFRLNPFGKYGAVSKDAMIGSAEAVDVREHPPVDSPKVTQQTLRIINAQAKDAMKSRLTDGLRTATWRITLGDIEIQKINGTANDQIQDAQALYQSAMANARAGATGTSRHFARRGFSGDSMARQASQNLSDDLAQIEQWRQLQTSYQYYDARVQALRAQIDARERATHIQSSANELADQLAQPYKPGQPRLRAFGTNLYVRYYGSEASDGSDRLPPADPGLKATPTSLATRNSK